MPSSRASLPGSHRSVPPGKKVGAINPEEPAEISVYLKAPAAGLSDRATLQQNRQNQLAAPIARLKDFAAEYGLTITLEDPARRLIKLGGPLGKLQEAFGTTLDVMENEGKTFRGRQGALNVPSDLCDHIESVLGLDTRPAATPKIAFPRIPEAASAHLPNQVALLYGFPTKGHGKGQCIALIELGGGYLDTDNKAAFSAMGLSPPAVTAVPVSGGSNAPGGADSADGEVALDIQVAGGAAPGSRIAVYFAPNTDQGFVDAITAAIHDDVNKPSVLSISWGSAESQWTQQAVNSMSNAFADAAQLGVTVCAASGDGLATDGVNDGVAHVDFPASSPYVLGCGGTKITNSGNALTAETVWNSDGGGTGGGISALFALPEYQDKAKVPVSTSTNKIGRGVPDVAADADPNSGYRVIVQGQSQVIGGTSAAAPLWAGLVALINEARGSSIGQPHVTLYANASVLRDITQGNNRSDGIGYQAKIGWDACTGLGSPKGEAVASAFVKTQSPSA
jgi:kumamolisin